MSENRSTVRESLREMVVVVVSILIAFGLDAAWDEGRERARERRLLDSLLADMRWNIEELDRNLELQRDIRDGGRELLALMGPTPASVDLARFDSLVFRTATYWTYDPRIGAIDVLLANLEIVSDEGLRSLLAAWPETLRDLREDEDRAAREVDEEVLPRLYPHVPIGVHVEPASSDQIQPVFWPEAGARRLTQAGARGVLSDLAIANAVTYRIGRQEVILHEIAALRALMVDLVARIEAGGGS